MTSKNTINEIQIRMEFEKWARQKGSPVRRRDDKPDVYLFSETQHQWLLWSEAYIYGKMAALAQSGTSRARKNTLPAAVPQPEAPIEQNLPTPIVMSSV